MKEAAIIDSMNEKERNKEKENDSEDTFSHRSFRMKSHSVMLFTFRKLLLSFLQLSVYVADYN